VTVHASAQLKTTKVLKGFFPDERAGIDNVESVRTGEPSRMRGSRLNELN